MIKLLPFILVPILLLAGLGYWRYSANKTSPISPQTSVVDQTPVEVPKALPNATLEDRVKVLEGLVTKLANRLTVAPVSSDSRISDLEAASTELKARVSALENVSPVAAASGKSTVYIPLGAGGSWSDVDWHSLTEYEVSLNPDNYPGYTGMSLEANFRLIESVGTGSVRLYNVSDSSAVSGEVSSASTAFSLQSSSSFKLASGTKTYRLQVKSSQNKELFIQSARIKVSF